MTESQDQPRGLARDDAFGLASSCSASVTNLPQRPLAWEEGWTRPPVLRVKERIGRECRTRNP